MSFKYKYLFIGSFLLGFKLAFAVYEPGVGDIALDLSEYLRIISSIILVICVAIGFALIITGLIQIKMHFQNPKFIPLPTPIVYVIIGLILLILPFIESIFGYGITSYKYIPPITRNGVINSNSGKYVPDPSSGKITPNNSKKYYQDFDIDIDKPIDKN